jgi:hypothetical protein
MPQPEETPPNLLELIPHREIAYETDEEGQVILKMPRFHHPLAVRLLGPFLRSPAFDLRLDAFGSFVWVQCDGFTTVAEIGERLREEFGDQVEPLWDRLGKFLRKLEREDLLRVGPEAEA